MFDNLLNNPTVFLSIQSSFSWFASIIAIVGYIKIYNDCPEGWASVSMLAPGCFRVTNSSKGLNLTQSHRECEDAGATLASIHNERENLKVSSLTHGEAWIDGMWLKDSNNYIWQDGSNWGYSNGLTEEPEGDKYCLQVSEDKVWIPASCGGLANECVCRRSSWNGLPTGQISGALNGILGLAPETHFGIFFSFLPGICLCILSCIYCGQYELISNKQKILSSLLLLLPSTVFSVLHKFTTYPLQFLWFFGDENGGRKKLRFRPESFHSDNTKLKSIFAEYTAFYYGAILSFCLNLYILSQSPFTNWSSLSPYTLAASLLFGIYNICVTPNMLCFFKNEQGIEKTIFFKLKKLIASFFGCNSQSAPANKEPKKIKEKKHKLHILFFVNSVYNIGTMALFISYCKIEGSLWMVFFYFLPLLIFIMGFFSKWSCGFQVPFPIRLQMAWTNLFVPSVYPMFRNEIRFPIIASLQMFHNIMNIAAMAVLFFRPVDLFLGIYLFCALFSVLPFFWFLRITWIEMQKIDPRRPMIAAPTEFWYRSEKVVETSNL